MIFSALNEAANMGELILRDGGLCRWHRRKDGLVTIREIIVLPSRRGQGVGRAMVEEVRAKNPGLTVQACCPVSYFSNTFWSHLGFTLQSTTIKGNLWRLPG